jgi:hypothetical protein
MQNIEGVNKAMIALPPKILHERAHKKRPRGGTKEYGEWYRARRILGLPTEPEGVTKNYRAYMSNYMKSYRKKKEAVCPKRKPHRK